MALVIRSLYNAYAYMDEYSDPRVKNLLLVSSPIPVIITIVSYLFFVNTLGPKLMEKRKPFELKNVIRAYNLIQIILNLSLCILAVRNSYFQKGFSLTCQKVDTTNTEPYMNNLLIATHGYYLTKYTDLLDTALPNSYFQKGFSLTCQKVDTTNTEPSMKKLLIATHGYYLTKYIDLFDTVFFVLRKKYSQITFLHIYHHAGMVFGVWLYVKFLAGSHSTLLGIINSFVHVIMYTYYFLTSLNKEWSKSLWWKKYLTRLQLLQFGILTIHYAFPILNNWCDHPKAIAFIGFTQNIFMFALFSDFYYKAYIKKKK